MPRIVNKNSIKSIKSIKSKKLVKGGSRTSLGLPTANSNKLARRLARARMPVKYVGQPSNLRPQVRKPSSSSPRQRETTLNIIDQYKLYTKHYLDVRKKLHESLLKYKMGKGYDLVKVKQALKPPFFSKNIEMIEEFQALLRKRELLTSLVGNLKKIKKNIVNTKSKKKVNSKQFNQYMVDKLLGVSKNAELLKKNLITIRDSKDGGTGGRNEIPDPPTHEPMPDISHLSSPVYSNRRKSKKRTAVKL